MEKLNYAVITLCASTWQWYL